ncbi:hypothetical protein J6590_054571 [Homalodisca vitripennis]|nr:hypothetical protein J6590_054571 [Homalodisca vitripennis]
MILGSSRNSSTDFRSQTQSAHCSCPGLSLQNRDYIKVLSLQEKQFSRNDPALSQGPVADTSLFSTSGYDYHFTGGSDNFRHRIPQLCQTGVSRLA